MKFFRGLLISLAIVIPFWLLVAYCAFGADAPCSTAGGGAGICYVDTASDGGDGTTTATTGAQAAFKTIAVVNGYTYAAGDQILFKRGGTWREQLTVPSSGSAGSHITFGAYGSGAKPRITGGDAVSSWSNAGSDLDDNFDDNNIADWTVAGTGVGVANQRIEAIWTDKSGNQSVYKLGGTARAEMWASFRWYITSYSIANSQRMIGSGMIDAAISSVLLVGLYNDAAGDKQYAIAYRDDAGETVVYVDLTPPVGEWIDVMMYFKAASTSDANDGIVMVWINDTLIYSKVDVDNNSISAKGILLGDRWGTSATTDYNAYFDDAKLGQYASGVNLYRADVTTAPKGVIIGTTYGSIKTYAAACRSVNDWYWVGHVLYLNATSSPSGVEVASRTQVITINGKNNVTIDGFQLDLSNEVWPSGAVYITGTTSDLTIQNCDIKWSGYGIYGYSGTGDNNIFQYNDVQYIYSFGMVFTDVNCGSGTECYIRGNTVSNGHREGIHVRSNYYIIERNIVHDNGNSGTDERYEGIHTYTLNVGEGLGLYNIIRYNIVYNQTGYGNDGIGICVDQWCNYNEVYYNVVYGCTGPGIANYDASNTKIYNNVMYNNNTSGADEIANFVLSSTATSPTNVVVKNNISYAVNAAVYAIVVGTPYIGGIGNLLSNNIWYAPNKANWYYWNGAGGSNLATWNALAEVGTDLNAAPIFVNAAGGNFYLLPTSPARDAGTDVSLTQDYLGTVVPIGTAPDIGAYEYVPLGSPGRRIPGGMGVYHHEELRIPN